MALLLLSVPALLNISQPIPLLFRTVPPIGQSARGELIYSMDCEAIKTNYKSNDYKTNIPPTNMKRTVIPKSDGVQNPATTPTKGESL
jgi:hypothetical protein